MWIRDGDTGVRRGRGGTRGMQGYGGDTGVWWGQTCNGDVGVQWGHGCAMGTWRGSGDTDTQLGCGCAGTCDGEKDVHRDAGMRWDTGACWGHEVGTWHACGGDTCKGGHRHGGDRDTRWGPNVRRNGHVMGQGGVVGTGTCRGDTDARWGRSHTMGTGTRDGDTAVWRGPRHASSTPRAAGLGTRTRSNGVVGVREGVCRRPPTRLVPAR